MGCPPGVSGGPLAGSESTRRAGRPGSWSGGDGSRVPAVARRPPRQVRGPHGVCRTPPATTPAARSPEPLPPAGHASCSTRTARPGVQSSRHLGSPGRRASGGLLHRPTAGRKAGVAAPETSPDYPEACLLEPRNNPEQSERTPGTVTAATARARSSRSHARATYVRTYQNGPANRHIVPVLAAPSRRNGTKGHNREHPGAVPCPFRSSRSEAAGTERDSTTATQARTRPRRPRPPPRPAARGGRRQDHEHHSSPLTSPPSTTARTSPAAPHLRCTSVRPSRQPPARAPCSRTSTMPPLTGTTPPRTKSIACDTAIRSC